MFLICLMCTCGRSTANQNKKPFLWFCMFTIDQYFCNISVFVEDSKHFFLISCYHSIIESVSILFCMEIQCKVSSQDSLKITNDIPVRLEFAAARGTLMCWKNNVKCQALPIPWANVIKLFWERVKFELPIKNLKLIRFPLKKFFNIKLSKTKQRDIQFLLQVDHSGAKVKLR